AVTVARGLTPAAASVAEQTGEEVALLPGARLLARVPLRQRIFAAGDLRRQRPAREGRGHAGVVAVVVAEVAHVSPFVGHGREVGDVHGNVLGELDLVV